MDNALRALLLVLHELLAVGLLGAMTHQAIAASIRVSRTRGGSPGRGLGFDPSAYSKLIVALFLCTTLLGAVLYPSYRIVVTPVLQLFNLRAAAGVFEIKEHLSTLGLLVLPAYWAAWRRVDAQPTPARHILTWFLTGVVWWSFIVGAVLTNIQGLHTR